MSRKKWDIVRKKRGDWVKQNEMKAKSNKRTLYRINNIFESDFPGSCTRSDDLFSFVWARYPMMSQKIKLSPLLNKLY